MWLIRQKRYGEAVDVLSSIAKINNRPMPPLYFEKLKIAFEKE